MTRAYRFLLAILVLALSAGAASAQVATGTPPFGSFSGGPDVINLANLNAHFSVPVFHKPGRGMAFSLDLGYDTSVWYPVTSGTTTSWQPVSNWGWTGSTQAAAGYLSSSETTVQCGHWEYSGGYGWYVVDGYKYDYSNWVFHDMFGVAHAFSGVSVDPGTCPDTNPLGFTATATDRSGYTLSVTGASGKVSNSDRTLTQTQSNSTTLTDRHGNQITVSSNGVFTDTLGMTALAMSGSGVPGDPQVYTYHYLDSNRNAAPATVKVYYKQYTVATNFGASGISEYGAHSVSLVDYITLPNGTSYSFTYEPTPSTPSNGACTPLSGTYGANCVTGRLTSITLPMAGTITYSYTGGNNGILSDGSAAGLTRTVSDGTTPSTWIYTRTPANGSNPATTTITAPAVSYSSGSVQTVSVLAFDANNHETSRKIYQGSPTGNPVRTVSTSWDPQLGTPTSHGTTLEDGTTLVGMTNTTYDLNGNLLSVAEYAQGTLVRTTTYLYVTNQNYTSRSINDLVSRVTVTNGSGTTVSQTDIAYDENTILNCPTGVPQHDDVNHGCAMNYRGNPTTVTRWNILPSGQYHLIPRVSTYDVFGNVLTAQLNCCQTKQWNYSGATQYAYPDSVTIGTSPTQLITSATYDLNTGLVLTSTDENSQTTSFAYDNMGRVADIKRPDQKHIIYQYNDPALWALVKSPLQNGTVVEQQTFVDTLGRAIRQQSMDGSGAVQSIVDTQYDPLGRAYRASNPHNSTAQYWSETDYDALGRPTATIGPDGGQSSASYSLRTVTTTDPAGKQRKSVSDGLGRLIEVDEPSGSPSPATSGSGPVTITGSERSMSGTRGTRTLTVNGYEQSATLDPCQSAGAGSCPYTIYDSGSVSVTVNGFNASITYGQMDTAGTMASGLAYALNASSSPVVATASGSTVTVWSKTTGSSTNYSFTTSKQSNDPSHFGSGSFWVTPSSGALSGGSNSGTTYDAGTVSITVSGLVASVNYGQSDSAPSVALNLKNAINASSLPVTATLPPNGTTLTLTAKTAGSNTNYSVSTSSSSSAGFSPVSFSASGSALTGGADAQPLGSTPYVTLYSYDALDRLTQVTQGAQTRTNVYDALGRLTISTMPEAGMACFGTKTGSTCNQDGYDDYGNLLTTTDARGVVTTYTYDGLNRPTAVSYNVSGATGVPATPGVTITYGTSAANNNSGRLVSMSNGTSLETYHYSTDGMGRVASVDKVINNMTYTTSYQYNDAGELTYIHYPSGTTVQQNLDNVGRLTGVTSGAVNYTSGIAYNVAGQVTGLNYGNGVAAAFTYKPDTLQLSSLTYAYNSSTLFSASYWYKQDATNCPIGAAGNNGQLQCIQDTVQSGRSSTYVYDPLHRLAQAVTAGSTAYPKWDLMWTYDQWGNRLNQAVQGDTASAQQFQQAGQLPPPAMQVAASTTTNRLIDTGTGYAYDANGNMTNDGVHTLVYDAANRIVTAANGGTTLGTYAFDGNGLRVSKTANGISTVYVYSGSQVIAEYDNGAGIGTPSREYIYSGGARVAKLENGATTYFHQDHLSARVLTNANGAIVGELGHYPFGEKWYETGTTTKQKFTTYDRDSETGNDYTTGRMYASNLGRFLSPDLAPAALGDPQSWNRYTYVENDPVNGIDPSGWCGLSDPDGGNSGGGICDPGAGGADPIIAAGIDTWLGGGWASWAGDASNPGIGMRDMLAAREAFMNSLGTSDDGIDGGCAFGNCFGMEAARAEAEYAARVALAFAADPCIYLNKKGTGVESIDRNSSPKECKETGGKWVEPQPPGTTYGVGPDGEVYVSCFGGDAICDAQGNVVRVTENIVSANGMNMAMASIPGAFVDAAAGPAESVLFGRARLGMPGLFNSNQWLRIGWGWKAVDDYVGNVFRIGGRLIGGRHIDLWPPSAW